MGISETLNTLPAGRLVGLPTFMRYLLPARNCILPRMSRVIRVTVDPHAVTGFSTLERLANIISVTRLDYSSLQERNP